MMATKPQTKITLRSPKNVLWSELCKAHAEIESAESLLGEYRVSHALSNKMDALNGKLIANFEIICANYQKIIGQMAHRMSDAGIDPGLGAAYEELKVVTAKPKLKVIEGVADPV